MTKEAQAAARQGRSQQPRGRLIEAVTHRQQPHGGDTAHAGGQAIQTIQPVDRIGDAYQPDHRGDQAQTIRQRDRARRPTQKMKGEIDRPDLYALAPHRNRHQHLAAQAGQRGQGEQVIGQADHKETEGAGDGGPDLAIALGRQLHEPPHQPDQGQGDDKTAHDADPAQAHHRRGVLLARIGLINQAPAQTSAAHDRHQQRRAQGRDAERQNSGEIRPAGDHRGRCAVGIEAQMGPAGRSLNRAQLRGDHRRTAAGQSLKRAAVRGPRRTAGSARTGRPRAHGSAARSRRLRG